MYMRFQVRPVAAAVRQCARPRARFPAVQEYRGIPRPLAPATRCSRLIRYRVVTGLILRFSELLLVAHHIEP